MKIKDFLSIIKNSSLSEDNEIRIVPSGWSGRGGGDTFHVFGTECRIIDEQVYESLRDAEKSVFVDDLSYIWDNAERVLVLQTHH